MIIKWDTEKVLKYLASIDLAITRGKYAVAMKLANRLLKHYYRSFISEKISAEQEADNIRLMSTIITRYLIRHYRQYKIPYSEKRLMVMQLISSVLVIYMMNTSDTPEDMQVIDKATATYIRDNVGNVVTFLSKYA
jgi:hypothetical protein